MPSIVIAFGIMLLVAGFKIEQIQRDMSFYDDRLLGCILSMCICWTVGLAFIIGGGLLLIVL